MAVTKQQLAQWSREFDAKNPDRASGTGSAVQSTTTKKSSVTREQLSQWSREFEQKQAAKKQAEAAQKLGGITSGLAAGGQMTQQNPAVKWSAETLNKKTDPDITRAKALQQYTERHASDMGEVDRRRDEMSNQLSNDVYAQVNNWKDADTRNRQLYELVKNGKTVELEDGYIDRKPATDADLRKEGYRPDEIKTARTYVEAYDKLGLPYTAARRLANTAKGTAANIAGGTAMMAGALPQAVGTEVKDDDEMRTLMRAVQRVDGTNGKYTDADLIRYGHWTQAQIDEARQRLKAGEDPVKVDNPVYNWGRDTHKEGERLTADAMAGESNVARFWHGAATSAAENLILANINPALILPVLSAQGAGDSMAQSDAKGENVSTALLKAGAKFGAGWAINSVGAADLAKTMGSDYAKDTLAGQIADWVQGLAGSSELAKRYPAVAAAISGGIDNSMQAFAETYADMAIDAALGDSEAAKNLFSKDTFLTALESGLSGGASGALGGAIGTGLRGMSEGLDRAIATTANGATDGSADRAMARQKEWEARVAEPSQSAADSSADRALAGGEPLSRAAPDSSPTEGSLWQDGKVKLDAQSPIGREMAGLATEASGTGPEERVLRTEETAVNDDPAVHTAAQNASIEEYKNSVDPGLAEYVDRVRAGEKLDPYVVAETGDRMRSAMMELTGLEKVGDRTLMDSNAVQHITNRHAGGDGSADGTMKESADVARAAYVLNNFDNAYLAKDRAKGYRTSNGKRAPIVLFEKKIDGSHIVVEAVCDTKKNQNFIVSEYLAKNGVDEKEIAKVLQAPVNAVASPGDNVRNVVAGTSAKTSIASEGEVVNAPLRETLGLRPEASQTQRQAEVRRALEGWQVTDKAAETISKNMPDKVDTDRYAAAASPLYRLGRKGAATFAQALELAGSMSGTAADINYILSTDAGRTALEIAYTQGKGERMRYAEKMAGLGGALGSESTSGRGEVYDKGTMRPEGDAADQIIRLNAAATGTDAVLYNVLQNDRSVRAYVDTETARIFFGDNAQDIFGTVLHEDYHWYNALDAEGARTLQEHALEYLAKSSGYESLDEMIRAKLENYSAQSLTYEQAAEELVADAWRGIFDSEESFKRWVEFQRGQAEKNAGKSGAIRKVMEQVRQMLDTLISRAKEVLTIDPDNRAALKAKRLAEAEKRTLQDEYFAHAEKAMDNLRAAKENAAALKTEGAAEKQGVRFQLHEGKDSLEEQMNKNINELEKMHIVATVNGNEVAFGKNNSESIENIERFFDSIGNKAVREGFGTVELLRKGARATVRHGNSAAKQAAVAAIPAVIREGKQIGYEQNWQGRGYDTYVFAAPVEINGIKLYQSVIVNSYLHDNRRAFYVHEVCWTDGSFVTMDSAGKPTKKEDTSTQLSRSVLSLHSETQKVSSEQSIAQTSDESKRTDEPVKKTVRFQKAEQADRDAKQNQQRQASRVLAEKAAAFDTLNQFFGLTKNTRLSDAALESLAIRWTKTNGSRADRTKLANETRALVEYLRSDGADMAKAQGLAETLAGEVLDEATYRNTELWNQYPELHDLTYTVDKNGKAKAELVKRYGSWTEAVAEARRHGVKLRQMEGYRDGNPAEQYEAIVNDTRAVGGVKESAAALFRSAAQEAGVAGAASMESTEWLDVLMNVHDTIKPKMMSRFADVAEYEDAKVELAGRMIGDIMSHPEMTDAEAVFEGILKHNREVAAMAAGSEERAAEVTKGLKSVQQAQRKAFADRMRENSRSQSAEAKSVSRAERQLNENLETLGAQVSTAAGLDEKMTALREAYEREWKAEKSRMKQARQEMLDEIKLERQQLRSQINDLSRQVAGEQRRADRAERQLLVQENEIMEWEEENQRKADAWQEKQTQRNAIAIETARQQRDEDVAVAKALAEKRVQKARDGRKADELKRSIRNNAAQLNQMVLRPKPGKYVQKSLIVQAAEVAKLADMTVLNNNAVAKLTALQDSIRRSGEMDAGIHADWENSGVENLIQTLRDDMNASKQAKLDRLNKQLEEAKALPDGDKAEQLRDRLRQRIRETENRTYLPMTVDQLRMLKAITASTLHMIRTENKTLSLARAEEVDGMAMKAAREVLNSEGNGFGEKFEKAKGAMNRYQLDMLGGTRMFRRLGGYTKNGQMEKLGQMLNDGQRRQTEILVEGESLFENVTGKEHLKEVEAFAGPGAELVDIGLKDSKGNAVPLNHAQLCSLYMLLRNEDSRHHLMTGGLTLPDAAQYAKGNIERAYQRSQTVMLGTLVNADGVPMADTILQTVQDAMTDYDRAWCEDMKDFFGRYTTNLINETSMKLLGYDRATVKNYYPIAVDRSTLATEIEGVKMDATIEGRGFLKERVKSDKPILLEECQNVVNRSLRDTAAYAGLAAPIRDVQRVLNSTVETAEGIGVLKDKIIGEKWGRETVSYINDLLTDLQTRQRHRSSTMSRALDRMRGNYAGAILTVNPGVAIAQAASLPTAGAVLGADTMAAVLPFVKNFSGKQRAAVEAEIRQHGDALLQYRLRGTKRGEMSSIGAHKNLVAKASEAMPAVTGWITGMDEITVAALWEGAKRYVEHHAAEFGEGAAEKGSEAYWEAVNKMYQRVIEETQPNYTTMQRAGIQRSDNEFVKTLTMFTTQRFQNYGILADAVGDYKAQKVRYAADKSAENKAEVQRAGRDLGRAAVSQVVQTAVFALMKIGADFLLHRWDKEQDENGDITATSVGKRFFDLYTESAAGNFLYGSEVYSILTNARDGKDYDVVSATNISAVNDLSAAFTKTVKLLQTDTSEMNEEELAAHHQKLNKAVLKDIQCGLELYGVPAANIRKVIQAFEGYWEDAQAISRGEEFSFNSVPSSATGQYDRLYNAIQSGDSEEAAAAMKKLEQMGKTDKVDSQLKTRLKKYDADILEAAKAQNAGKEKAAETARKAAFRKLLDGLDVGSKDSARRTELANIVTGAVNEKANELLLAEKGRNKDASVYADLLDEVENGRVKDVQAEITRLMTAGKDKGSIKSKITEAVKEEYLAGNDGDREKLEKKLLALEDADGNALYEEKNFAQWVSAADKKAEKAKDEKNWWEGGK